MLRKVSSSVFYQKWNERLFCSCAYVNKLFHKLYVDHDLHSSCSSNIEYRNKMTANFQLPSSQPADFSNLALPEVDEACKQVEKYAAISELPKNLWYEYCIQKSRTNQIMLKISLFKENEKIWSQFEQQIPTMITYFQTHIPQLESIVYQITENNAKPTKSTPTHTIFGPGTLSTVSPCAKISLRYLSGAFLEPNEEMEEMQQKMILNWFSEIKTPYTLICKGREVMVYGEEISSLGYAQRVVCFTPCERVFQSCSLNFKTNPNINASFFHVNNQTLTSTSEIELNQIAKELSHQSLHELTFAFMVTSGRKGFPKDYVNWLKTLPNISQIVYSSCNQNNTEREIQWFLSGPNGFIIDKFHTFDMHPCTEFHTIMICFKRVSITLLPVGGIGFGKTTFGKLCQEKFPKEVLTIVNRDDIFFACKEKGLSLRKAREETKNTLESIIKNSKECVLYVDTSNKFKSGRIFFHEISNREKPIELNFQILPEEQEEITRDWIVRRQEKGYPLPEKTEEELIDFHSEVNSSIEYDDDFGWKIKRNFSEETCWDLFQYIFGPEAYSSEHEVGNKISIYSYLEKGKKSEDAPLFKFEGNKKIFIKS